MAGSTLGRSRANTAGAAVLKAGGGPQHDEPVRLTIESTGLESDQTDSGPGDSFRVVVSVSIGRWTEGSLACKLPAVLDRPSRCTSPVRCQHVIGLPLEYQPRSRRLLPFSPRTPQRNRTNWVGVRPPPAQPAKDAFRESPPSLVQQVLNIAAPLTAPIAGPAVGSRGQGCDSFMGYCLKSPALRCLQSAKLWCSVSAPFGSVTGPTRSTIVPVT